MRLEVNVTHWNPKADAPDPFEGMHALLDAMTEQLRRAHPRDVVAVVPGRVLGIFPSNDAAFDVPFARSV